MEPEQGVQREQLQEQVEEQLEEQLEEQSAEPSWDFGKRQALATLAAQTVVEQPTVYTKSKMLQ